MSASPTWFRVVAAAGFGAMGGYLASVMLAWVAFSGAFAAVIAVASKFNRHAPPGATGGVAAGAVFGMVFVVTLAASTGLILRSVVRSRVSAVAIAALVLPLTPLHVIALWLVARESHETWGTLVAAFPRGEWALFAPACAAGMLAFIWREHRGWQRDGESPSLQALPRSPTQYHDGSRGRRLGTEARFIR